MAETAYQARVARYQYQMSQYWGASVAIEEALGNEFDPRFDTSGDKTIAFSLETVLSLRQQEKVDAVRKRLVGAWIQCLN